MPTAPSANGCSRRWRASRPTRTPPVSTGSPSIRSSSPKLSPVAATHRCRHGEIAAEWSCEGDRVTYAITLPEGCEGIVPDSAGRRDLTHDGAAVTGPLTLAPGHHELKFTLTDHPLPGTLAGGEAA